MRGGLANANRHNYEFEQSNKIYGKMLDAKLKIRDKEDLFYSGYYGWFLPR